MEATFDFKTRLLTVTTTTKPYIDENGELVPPQTRVETLNPTERAKAATFGKDFLNAFDAFMTAELIAEWEALHNAPEVEEEAE